MLLKMRAVFELIKREGEASSQNLWYKDPEQGWIQAEERMGNPRIPSGAFKFLTRCQDPIIEGVALIAFTRKGEKPVTGTAGNLMYISGNRRDKDVNNQDNRNLLHPSMLQIQYLLELEKNRKKARKCCDDCGYLWGESWTSQPIF